MLFLVVVFFPILSNSLTIGTGSASSCTFSALKNAIDTSTAGSTINFNCGSNPHTIALTSTLWITRSVTIDGANKITLNGQSKYRHFIVANKDTTWGIIATKGTQLILKNINVINGGGNPVYIAARVNWGSPNWNNPIPKRDGGCIYLGVNAVARISNTNFVRCQTRGRPITVAEPLDTRFRGGAIFVHGGQNSDSALYVTGCTFCNSYASEQGGAIFASWLTKIVDIKRTTFYSNTADGSGEEGGGALLVHDTRLNVADSVFALNSGHLGGAIRVLLADIAISNSVFYQNTAKVYPGSKSGVCCARGGAIYIDGASRQYPGGTKRIDITSSAFEENKSGGRGGAVYMCIYSSDQSKIVGTTFTKNMIGPTLTSDQHTGGGIHLDCGGRLTFTNTKISGNTVYQSKTTAPQMVNFGVFGSPYSFVNSYIPGYPKTTSDPVPGKIIQPMRFASVRLNLGVCGINSNGFPTMRPTPPTKQPTVGPTTANRACSGAEVPCKLEVTAGSNQWWLRIAVRDVQDTAITSKVLSARAKGNGGTWVQGTKSPWGFVFQSSGFQTPITMEMTMQTMCFSCNTINSIIGGKKFSGVVSFNCGSSPAGAISQEGSAHSGQTENKRKITNGLGMVVGIVFSAVFVLLVLGFCVWIGCRKNAYPSVQNVNNEPLLLEDDHRL